MIRPITHSSIEVTHMTQSKQNESSLLTQIADSAMQSAGFFTEYSKQDLYELSALKKLPEPKPLPTLRDMRDTLWVSIDNDDTLDLDQLTYAEVTSDKTNKIYVAIADVDSLVHTRSAIDQYAAHNTTSVYTPTKTFPMLHNDLSTGLTSLNEQCDRKAIVVEIEVDPDGLFSDYEIYPALVRNQAKLTYNGVAEWLKNHVPLPNPKTNRPEILEQLVLQDRMAQLIKKYRYHQGALTFVVADYEPVIVDGIAVRLEEVKHNRAHGIIENYMIAANVCVARYMVREKIPGLRRIVRKPKRWDRIIALAADLGEKLPEGPDAKALQQFLLKQQKSNPSGFSDLSLAIIKLIGRGEYVAGIPGDKSQGHFDLALHDYAHSTAPNRRYPDLILQRQLKNHLSGQGLIYQVNELIGLGVHCTQKEMDATKVERHVRKSAAAMVLHNHIGQEYPALVTGVNENGTWVRLFEPPIEGKLSHGDVGLDVGDRIIVKLIHTDVVRGHIDFARVRGVGR